jgi:hypothetical protein
MEAVFKFSGIGSGTEVDARFHNVGFTMRPKLFIKIVGFEHSS